MATLISRMPMNSTRVFATFKKFVVAYDFSPCAEAALECALDLATKQNAKINLVFARHAEASREARQNIPSVFDESLQRVAECSRKHGIDVRYQIKVGSPAEALRDVATEIQPDIIFLGAYGNNRLDRKILGSTAESLLRTLPCPLVILGPKAIRNIQPDQPVKLICPVDFPEDVHERLSIIARLAKVLSADVELVHAVDISHDYSRPHSAADIQFEFDLLTARLLREGVIANSRLLYGTPEGVITEFAQEINADYIVFGLHKVGRFSSYFRKSLVAKVIKNAPCAILTYAQAVQTETSITPEVLNIRRIPSLG